MEALRILNPGCNLAVPRAYEFSFPFNVFLGFNYWCIDEISLKKPREAVGMQFYSDRFEAEGHDCDHGKGRATLIWE